MKFQIVGSGGCVALPKPLCDCPICEEARTKGQPYARCGCSLYMEDMNLLIDTPEDIVQGLNLAGIKKIDRVAFSHLDPDHTLGMRVFEHLRLNWFKVSEGEECTNPITLYALPHVMGDLNEIRTKHGSILDYYESGRHLIKRKTIEAPIKLDEVTLTFVPAGVSTVFVFQEKEKKLLYAPCDVKPFPEHSVLYDADVLLIGNTIPAEVLKGGFQPKPGNFLLEDLFSMAEIKAIKEKYRIKQVIITHLEEDWGRSYDDYIDMEKTLDGISFAYDGQRIILE